MLLSSSGVAFSPVSTAAETTSTAAVEWIVGNHTVPVVLAMAVVLPLAVLGGVGWYLCEFALCFLSLPFLSFLLGSFCLEKIGGLTLEF